MSRLLLVSLAALVVATAGCVRTTGPGAELPPVPTADPGAKPHVVVAVVDTGINPYHLAFRGGPDLASVPGFDGRAINLTLAQADYDAAATADEGAWADVAEGELVYFPGTRVGGISFKKAVPDSKHALIDDHGHGTATSDAVVNASPHALVVHVQIEDDEDIITAMEWAAGQPWIDVISVSWGKYSLEYAEEPMMGLPAAYAKAWQAGKLIVNSAGNEPLVHWTDEHNGPPFVIAVGGVQGKSRGETTIAAKAPDVVSDFTQIRAEPHSTDKTSEISGTSFSGPRVAGTLAEAIYLVREAVGYGGNLEEGALVTVAEGAGALADGKLTAAEVRDAMNRHAVYWAPSEWRPQDLLNDGWPSAPVVLPWLQMGWGYVGAELAEPIAKSLLGETELPAKPPEAEAFMTARERARAAAWGV